MSRSASTRFSFNGKNVGSSRGLAEAIKASVTKKVYAVSDNVAEMMFDQIREMTPVKTGYARSRWKIIGKGNHLRIVNDANYIDDLEYGSSRQAPNGMVRLTAMSFREFVKMAVQKVRADG